MVLASCIFFVKVNNLIRQLIILGGGYRHEMLTNQVTTVLLGLKTSDRCSVCVCYFLDNRCWRYTVTCEIFMQVEAVRVVTPHETVASNIILAAAICNLPLEPSHCG